MTISDINSYVTFRTGQDTTNYTAANRLISTNRWYHKVITMILASQDEWDWDDSNQSDFSILTTDLVLGQQDYELPVSEEILKLKRLEVTYDGSNWYKAEPFDVNEYSGALDTTSIASHFSQTAPRYDLQNNSLFLYPIPNANVTAGLKAYWTREADEFTSAQVTTGTKEPGFDEPFHMMIPLGMCYDWFIAKKLYNEAKAAWDELVDYEQRLKQHYSSKQQDRKYQLTAAYSDYE